MGMKGSIATRRTALVLANAAAALPLAAFFGFVGFYKAFAPIAELARHSAFTVHLPEALGRSVGWVEMVCALALMAGLVWRRAAPAQVAAALFQAVMQGISSIIHVQHGEQHMLGQNAAIVALLLLVAVTRARLSRRA
jgi:uncharacterized membrane protein YphA (DoxX/SURF4 family)